MLRSRKKDVNIKPNRKLDKRSSRGMLYENEELRLRTIEINAEVERGQCDLKKLRRENQRLRRDIWNLREEYERLECEMGRMRKGIGEEYHREEGERYDEEDYDEDDEYEEDEEEENAENLQKVNYYNNGGLGAAEDDGGTTGGQEGSSSVGGEDVCGGLVTFPSGGNLEQLVREVEGPGAKMGAEAGEEVANGDPSPPTPSDDKMTFAPIPSPPSQLPPTALLDASTLTPDLTMKDLFTALAPRLDSVVSAKILTTPGSALIGVRTTQDLEALLRTGLEVRGHLFELSDASLTSPDSPPALLVQGTSGPRVCKELGLLGSVREEDEGQDDVGRIGVCPAEGESSQQPGPIFPPSPSNLAPNGISRSPSPLPGRSQHSNSLPSTPSAPSPKFPPGKPFGHCRSSSADAGNASPSVKHSVNFEDTCETMGENGIRNHPKKKSGILRRNASQSEEEDGGSSGCSGRPQKCRGTHFQRSLSLDPKAGMGQFHRRKGTSKGVHGGSGVEADSENSRRGGSVSSRGSGSTSVGNGPTKGPKDVTKELPWCGCWGNGCF